MHLKYFVTSFISLKVCGIRLVSAGDNYPCGYSEKSRVRYGQSGLNSTDQLNIDYGYILNSGIHSHSTANDLR